MIKFNFMRSFATSGALCLLAFGAYAQKAEALIITARSGQETVFFLNERPAFVYTGNTITVQSSSMKAEIELADMDTMRFEEREKPTMTAITSTERDAFKVDLSDSEFVRVYGLEPGSELKVSTIAGHSLGRYTADSAGRVEVSLAGVPRGNILIISNPLSTLKIIKK